MVDEELDQLTYDLNHVAVIATTASHSELFELER